MSRLHPAESSPLSVPPVLGIFWECCQGHIVSVGEQRPPLVSPPLAFYSHPIFPHSVSTPHSPFFASIIKYPTLRNLNNVTQMEKASRSFSQSLVLSIVFKQRRKKSPCCSLPNIYVVYITRGEFTLPHWLNYLKDLTPIDVTKNIIFGALPLLLYMVSSPARSWMFSVKCFLTTFLSENTASTPP